MKPIDTPINYAKRQIEVMEFADYLWLAAVSLLALLPVTQIVVAFISGD